MSNCNDPLCSTDDLCLSCQFPDTPVMTLAEIRDIPGDEIIDTTGWDIDEFGGFDFIEDECLTDDEYEIKHGVSR